MPTSASASVLFSYLFSAHGDTDTNPYLSGPPDISSRCGAGRGGKATTEAMVTADNPVSEDSGIFTGLGEDSVGNCKAGSPAAR